jgi:uncharacterized membrane protein
MANETNLSDDVQSLAAIPLFKQLAPEALQRIAGLMANVSFEAGQAIFHQHDRGDALYLVHSGKVRIWVHDQDVNEVTLSELGAGQFFGEMAVLDGGERSANATAMVATTLHRLGRDEFQGFLLEYPQAALEVMRGISERLRQTNLLVSQRATRNVNQEMEAQLTFGQRIADRVAAFGGSWTFIFIFAAVLLAWMAVNTFLLARLGTGPDGAQWDPYPYILLNLVLSTLAALQAPVIMMSQNRAAEKDRLAAELDFKVNLKSELMLEELIRKQRERDVQMEELNSGLANLQRTNQPHDSEKSEDT